MNVLRIYSAPKIRIVEIAAQTILAGSDEPSSLTDGTPEIDNSNNNF